MLTKIESLLPDDLFPSSKNWADANLAERVELLVKMTTSAENYIKYLKQSLVDLQKLASSRAGEIANLELQNEMLRNKS